MNLKTYKSPALDVVALTLCSLSSFQKRVTLSLLPSFQPASDTRQNPKVAESPRALGSKGVWKVGSETFLRRVINTMMGTQEFRPQN